MFIDGYNRSASDIAGCIHTRINEGNYWFVIEMKNEEKINIAGKWSPNSESNGNVYDADGISPTILCGAHGGCEPRIKEENVPIGTDAEGCEPVFKGKIIKEGSGLYLSTSANFFRGGLEYLSRCLKTTTDAGVSHNGRIRKLTERECFRLMGVRDEDIDKIKAAGISKTQMYKMAGNSIVCDVLMAIFSNLLIADDNDDLF